MPQPNLQYPTPAALSRSMRNDGTFPPPQPSAGTFLHPRVNGALQSRYSAERVPFSATASASGDQRASSNDSRHNECYDNSPTISISDQPRSRHQDHYFRSKDNSLYDPEKAGPARHSPSYGHRPAHPHSTYVSEEEEGIKEHTVWVLVRLNPMISLLRSMLTNHSCNLDLPFLLLSRRSHPHFHLRPLHCCLSPPLLPCYRLRPTAKTSRPSIPHAAGSAHTLSTSLRLLYIWI